MKLFAFDLIEDRLRAARKPLAGLAAAGLLSFALVGGASADIAASGNGGTSDSDASGGDVSVGTTEEEDDGTDDGLFSLGGFNPFAEDVAATVIAEVTGDDTADDTADDGGGVTVGGSTGGDVSVGDDDGGEE